MGDEANRYALLAAPKASLQFLCHDKNDVPKIQIEIPIEETSFAQPGIELPSIVFQAENDISHGAEAAIHPLATDAFNLEPVPL